MTLLLLGVAVAGLALVVVGSWLPKTKKTLAVKWSLLVLGIGVSAAAMVVVIGSFGFTTLENIGKTVKEQGIAVSPPEDIPAPEEVPPTS